MRGRKPLVRNVNFYLQGPAKEHKRLGEKFVAVQAVFKAAVQLRIEEASKLLRNIAKNFGEAFQIQSEGKGYDYSLTLFLGDKEAAIEIEQAR